MIRLTSSTLALLLLATTPAVAADPAPNPTPAPEPPKMPAPVPKTEEKTKQTESDKEEMVDVGDYFDGLNYFARLDGLSPRQKNGIMTCRALAERQEGHIQWHNARRNGLFGLSAVAVAIGAGATSAGGILLARDAGADADKKSDELANAGAVFTATGAAITLLGGMGLVGSGVLYNMEAEEIEAAHTGIESAQRTAWKIAAGVKFEDVEPCTSALIRSDVKTKEIIEAARTAAENAADKAKKADEATDKAEKAAEAANTAKAAADQATSAADQAKRDAEQAAGRANSAADAANGAAGKK